MKLVIKIGGQAQEDAAQRRNIARQIAQLRRAGHRVVVVSALDNLGKGAAGQAVENMNLMFDFPWATALV